LLEGLYRYPDNNLLGCLLRISVHFWIRDSTRTKPTKTNIFDGEMSQINWAYQCRQFVTLKSEKGRQKALTL